MGIYYKYVNHTRKEYVDLSDLRGGGDKMNAVLWCGAVLGYLLMPGSGESQYGRADAYQGRWHSSNVGAHMAYGHSRAEPMPAASHPQLVNVEADYQDWWSGIEERYGHDTDTLTYTNITKPLLEEMRAFDFDYFDRVVSTGRRNCPEYHIVGNEFSPCVHPAGHSCKHEYGEWVALAGDDLTNLRKRKAN